MKTLFNTLRSAAFTPLDRAIQAVHLNGVGMTNHVEAG